ncbi:hypothetical protein O181_094452 [Austropuccinia psidii MF-1]|uniref:Uncharacterized protein n=1 Tax=Austropuccinia psidii MF-1 TaxID=1389203 RepID=A0A9Q3PBI8_9BASI|nr:hypothetical protein [Austropuccinia psidii MF-1]
MSVSTLSKKAADNDANAKPLSNKEVYSLLNSLRLEVLSFKSARSADAAKVQSLRMQISSSPLPSAPLQQLLHINTLAYKRFMQEPYCAANGFPKLQGDSCNVPEGVSSPNCFLRIAYNSKALVEDSPSLLDVQSPKENRAISHFIDASIPHNFALWIGIIPS